MSFTRKLLAPLLTDVVPVVTFTVSVPPPAEAPVIVSKPAESTRLAPEPKVMWFAPEPALTVLFPASTLMVSSPDPVAMA